MADVGRAGERVQHQHDVVARGADRAVEHERLPHVLEHRAALEREGVQALDAVRAGSVGGGGGREVDRHGVSPVLRCGGQARGAPPP
jgi:hypothetical protein